MPAKRKSPVRAVETPVQTRRTGRKIINKKPFDPSAPTSIKQILQRRKTICAVSFNIAHSDESSEGEEKEICIKCKSFVNNEDLINCTACKVPIHSKCLKADCEFLSPAEQLDWSCDKCRRCTVCSKASTPKLILFKCIICLNSYHRLCHDASGNIEKIFHKNRFRCVKCAELSKEQPIFNKNIRSNNIPKKHKCSNKKKVFRGFKETDKNVSSADKLLEKSTKDIRTSPDTSGSSDSFEGMSCNDSENCMDINDEETQTTVADWNISQVYEYFAKLFPKDAEIFRREEINGKVLLKLQQSHLVGLGALKLGPAIEIFGEVERLQKLNNAA